MKVHAVFFVVVDFVKKESDDHIIIMTFMIIRVLNIIIIHDLVYNDHDFDNSDNHNLHYNDHDLNYKNHDQTAFALLAVACLAAFASANPVRTKCFKNYIS